MNVINDPTKRDAFLNSLVEWDRLGKKMTETTTEVVDESIEQEENKKQDETADELQSKD